MHNVLLLIILFSISESYIHKTGSFGDPLDGCPYVEPSEHPPTLISQLRPSVGEISMFLIIE